jgi:hypothetical protein
MVRVARVVRTIDDDPALGELNVLRVAALLVFDSCFLTTTSHHQPPTMALSPPSSPISHPTSPTNFPTQTYHISILPRSIPTAGLLDSAVGGAHYSGVESVNERRRSVRGHSLSSNANENGAGAGLGRRRSYVGAEPNAFHLTVLDDLKDVRDSRHRSNNLFFSSWLDVRRFRDEGNAPEAMEEGCGIRGARQWFRRINLPPVISDRSLDGTRRTHTRDVKA